MDMDLNSVKVDMEKALEALEKDLLGIRTGRANTSLLEGVRVEVYGSKMPITGVSTITVFDAKTLVVSVWDAGNVQAVDSAIRKSELGLNPRIEGGKLFIILPELTQDRRKEFIKITKKKGEDIRIRIRNVRRDANEFLKKQEKEKLLSEDELSIKLAEIQKLTDFYMSEVDKTVEQKEKELETF